MAITAGTLLRDSVLLFLITIVIGYRYELFKSKFNKLRHITLRDDAFCEAYQEYKENNCIAKLTFCSPLTDDQTLKMRQILCGPKFNPDVQPPPHIQRPPDLNDTDPYFAQYDHHPPPYFLDVHPAQPNSFPWLAAVYDPERRFICSGALVSPRTVITSAQCINSAAGSGRGGGGGEGEGGDGGDEGENEELQNGNGGGSYFVRFGRHNLNLSSVYDKAYEYDVETIEISQQFNRTSLENDFAILKLVSPVCNFAPIALPKKDDWENGHYFGSSAPVLYAGWGLGLYQKPYLRSLSSHLMPKDICAKKFNWPHDQLSSSHLCVDPPINVCVGGIGTPLVSYTHHYSVLLGILSLGDHCNTPKLPLIFTKVSTYIDEIERFIEEDFRTMNESSNPLVDCLFKSTLNQPYFHKPHQYYPLPPYKYYDDDGGKEHSTYPKSHSQY